MNPCGIATRKANQVRRSSPVPKVIRFGSLSSMSDWSGYASTMDRLDMKIGTALNQYYLSMELSCMGSGCELGRDKQRNQREENLVSHHDETRKR